MRRDAAVEWVLGDKYPKLLPTPLLNPYAFEEFVEHLLRAERYLNVNVRHVTHVERWGTSGDRQDGIDLAGRFGDGVRAAWQCKHLDRLRPFEVRAAVNEVTYEDAEELYLVFSRVASAAARAEMKQHPGWTLLDRGQLTAMFRELPVQKQRDILDQTWGDGVRRLFLAVPGDAFVSLDRFVAMRRNPDAVMNDLGPWVGRSGEVSALKAALDRHGGQARRVVVVSGPAGRGKSRLVVEVLSALQEHSPEVPVVCLAAGHRFEAVTMGELRMGPMLILVDDAHTDPAALAPLLAFVRERTDVQLVLETRPSAEPRVDEQVALARFGPSECATVDVGRLTPKQARQLVAALTEGMDLSFPLRHYLAGQAEQGPFIAVITANLIRRGELAGSLRVDGDLRKQILSRYGELLVADVEGFPRATTLRVLATYTALGPIAAADRALMERIAGFCAMKVIDLARLLSVLRDRGVVAERGDLLRVVPDALADHVFEAAAAFEDFDSGFVAQLLDTFGADHHHRLALSIGELDWRLAQRGGPRVMAGVWATIRARLQTPYVGRLLHELDQLTRLAGIQPAEVVAVLDELRSRLDREDAQGIEPPEEEDLPAWSRLGLAPLNRNDVRAKMPELYARAVVNDSEQLEAVPDALWALRRCADGHAGSGADHPERLMIDRIANLAALPHPSFPARIVARVSGWLEGAESDPLFVLKPLLAKEGLESIQSDIGQLEFRSHLIDATRIRDIRERIRELLYEQALSENLRRAGRALELLREALRQPHGYFNQDIGPDVIMRWEEDDLATLEVFDRVARATAVPAVRRGVRHGIVWSAEHAESLRVRHMALAMLARLDRDAELADDVADEARNDHFGLAVVRDRRVPTLEQLRADRDAERARLAGMTDEQRQAERDARAREKLETRQSLHDVQVADLTQRLLDLGDIPLMIDLLDRAARAVLLLTRDRSVIFWGLLRTIADVVPDQLEPIVSDIAGRGPGPLDDNVPLLVDQWLRHDRDRATAWVQGQVVDGRRESKLAISSGFSAYQWHLLGHPFADIWAAGTNDPDPEVVQAYLAAAGAHVREHPVGAAELLLDRGISPFGAVRVIEAAANHDGRTFGCSLGADDAAAILRLVSRAGHGSYVVQETLTGIATAHPRLVLDHLAAQAAGGVLPPDIVHELSAAYDANADILAAWIRDNLESPCGGLVVATALNDHLSGNVAAALAELVACLDGRQLLSLAEILVGLNNWALDQSDLAHAVAGRAREVGVYEPARDHIRQAMRPGRWSMVNGVSRALGAALVRAGEAAGRTTDLDLRADYEAARADLQSLIEQERRRSDLEDDGG